MMKVNTLNLFCGFSGSVGETLGNDRISADWVSLLQQFLSSHGFIAPLTSLDDAWMTLRLI